MDGGRPGRQRLFDAAPLLVSISSLCLGSSFAKSLFPLAGAIGMTGMRNGLSAVLMTLVFRPWRWRLGRAQWRIALGYGAILGVMNLTFYLALERLPVGIAVALEFLGPLAVALFSSARRLDLIWVALAAGGVVSLALPAAGGARLDPLGVAFALTAAVGWAGYILVGQRASRIMAGIQAVSIGLLAAALVTVPLALAVAAPVVLRPAMLAQGALIAVLCSAIPYPLEMIALRRMPRHVFGVLLSVEPAFGAIAGFLVLGERLSLLRWLAIGAIVAASAGVTLTRGESVPAP